MLHRLFKRLRGCSGETIVEALVAVLISGLALLMLATAVGTATRVVTTTRDAIEKYYNASDRLATLVTSDKAIVSLSGSGVNQSIEVTYYTNNQLSGIPVTSYR